MESDSFRLNKYLALQLGVSRREADELIEKGKVLVNNTPAQLGGRASAQDTITVCGKKIEPATDYIYLIFNKPAGYVCSRRAQGSSPTIYTLLPQKYHALKPVGRLDKDSSGILLLSNDGDFTYRMTHPKFHKSKIYEVQLDSPLAPLHQQMISDFGVQLEDGPSKFTVQRIDERTNAYYITMFEGRNRQIRRTFGSLGYSVTALHRTHFGNYSLGDIPQGDYHITNMR